MNTFYISLAIISILHGIADWVLMPQFFPDLTLNERIISAVKIALLWPIYWGVALVEEFFGE